MVEAVRRVVTAIDKHGWSFIAKDEVVPGIETLLYPGDTRWTVWGTDAGARADGELRDAVLEPFLPEAGQTRFILTRFAGNASAGEVVSALAHDPGKLDAVLQDAEALMPGIASLHDSNEAGSEFHATRSIDFGMVIEGQIVLVLDNGDEAILGPGSCVIQNGARHAWVNRESEPALVAFFVRGSDGSSGKAR